MGEARDELTPNREAERIEQRIAATRDRLEDKLSRLESRTRDMLSVRQKVAARPWAAVGGAAALGFAVGLLRGRHDDDAEDDD